MPTTRELEERIERALPGASATVTDLTGGGDHLRAEVVYDGFAGLSRIEQHKLVYDVFGDEIGGRIHALSIKTGISFRNSGSSEGTARNSGSSEGTAGREIQDQAVAPSPHDAEEDL